MSIAALIRRMAELGTPAEAIALAVEAIEAEQAKDAERKAKRAAQKANERARKANDEATVERLSRDIEATVGDKVLSPSQEKERSPEPPKENSTLPQSPNLSVHRKRSTPSEFFEKFWSAYPRREGSNPKQPALKAFNREVSAGADPEAIIGGARRYATDQTGKDPRFVAQALTWLNQRRWEDEVSTAATGPPIAEVPKFETHEEHLAWWRDRQARA